MNCLMILARADCPLAGKTLLFGDLPENKLLRFVMNESSKQELHSEFENEKEKSSNKR